MTNGNTLLMTTERLHCKLLMAHLYIFYISTYIGGFANYMKTGKALSREIGMGEGKGRERRAMVINWRLMIMIRAGYCGRGALGGATFGVIVRAVLLYLE